MKEGGLGIEPQKFIEDHTLYFGYICIQRRIEKSLVGGVELNLPEFTWLISCCIATDQYLFQCVKAMFFGYLQAIGAESMYGY